MRSTRSTSAASTPAAAISQWPTAPSSSSARTINLALYQRLGAMNDGAARRRIFAVVANLRMQAWTFATFRGLALVPLIWPRCAGRLRRRRHHPPQSQRQGDVSTASRSKTARWSSSRMPRSARSRRPASPRSQNGAYQTAPTESPTTGKYKVRVMGYDKSKMRTDAAPGEIIEMPELFPEYAFDAEIPPPGRQARHRSARRRQSSAGNSLGQAAHENSTLACRRSRGAARRRGTRRRSASFPERRGSKSRPPTWASTRPAWRRSQRHWAAAAASSRTAIVVHRWGDAGRKGGLALLRQAGALHAADVRRPRRKGEIARYADRRVRLGIAAQGPAMTFRHLASMTSGYARPEAARRGLGLQRLRDPALSADALRPRLQGRPRRGGQRAAAAGGAGPAKTACHSPQTAGG